MGKEQPSQVLLLTEIGGSVKLLVGITHPFRTHTENRNDPTIQPTTVHSNQVTGLVYSYRDHLPLSSLKSGTDVWIGVSGKNIYNRTGLNPKGPIGTIIPDTNIVSNYDIFNSIIRVLDISYRISLWHGTEKNYSETLEAETFFENTERKNNFQVEKVGRKNSVIWNHKDSDLIHIDPSHIELDQPILAD